MLSDQLKEGTKTAHQELEKLLIKKIKSIQNVGEYVDILKSFYQFWKPLEKMIFSYVGDDVMDFGQRRKTDWIIQDLKYFNACPPEILPSHHLPMVRKSSQALGALYVTEGSTLGGQIICKMIAQRLEISTDQGFAFFSGYGEETGEMWKSFKSYLDGPSCAQEVQSEIIEAANRTFQLFEQSFRTEMAKDTLL